jgi:hydroxysqualene synthase
MNVTATSAIETPSGKAAPDENFPVGSWLLPARLRPHVAVFYRFARAIDDIADNPDLAPDDKIARLDAFEAALTGPSNDARLDTAQHMRQSLTATGVTDRHCRDLIAAFRQDAVKNRYGDWQDLMGYCRLSAAPVGRYLLDLHGGSADGYGPSDALCNALQVLNHLQDCQEDYRLLDRVYLPQDWMAAEGVDVTDLDRGASTYPMRRVLDRCLDGTDVLLATAKALPGGLVSWHLALESAVIVNIAENLSVLLRHRDPLAGRVALGRVGVLACGLRGMWRGIAGRRSTARIRR